MKFYKILIILLLSICLLTSCETEELYNCKVIDKTYQHDYTTLIPVYNGKTFYYIYQYHSEQFYLIIEGQNKEGETKIYSQSVSENTWTNIEIGQDWPISEGRL